MSVIFKWPPYIVNRIVRIPNTNDKLKVPFFNVFIIYYFLEILTLFKPIFWTSGYLQGVRRQRLWHSLIMATLAGWITSVKLRPLVKILSTF